MQKPILAVDICNTIANINLELEKAFEVKIDTEYRVAKATKEWFQKNTWIYLVAEPLPMAMEALQELSKDYEIVYLTARPESCFWETTMWLRNFGFPSGKLVSSTNKAQSFEKIGCSWAIDDCPDEIENYLKKGCNVIAFRQPYNQKYSSVVPVLDWQGIYTRLRKNEAFAV